MSRIFENGDYLGSLSADCSSPFSFGFTNKGPLAGKSSLV